MELPVPDVHGVDARGASLQEEVREAARRGTHIAADESRRGKREMVERALELESAARDVPQGFAGPQPQAGPGVEQLPRLLHPVIARDHLASQAERLRLAARFRKAPLLHEQIGADLHRCVAALEVAGPMMAWMRARRRSMSIGLEK